MTNLQDILADGALSRVLLSFKETTGIAARVMSPDGDLALAPTAWEDCSFCSLVRASGEGRRRCAASYARAAQQASSIGELYIFQCHAGLICWAAPLVAGGELLGSVLCGQVTMWQPDDFFVDEATRRTGDLGIDPGQLESAAARLEQVSPRRVQSAAELLFAIATYIVQSEDLALKQRNEIYLQQRLLGEAIQERKRLEQELNAKAPSSAWGMFSPRQERELMGAVRSGRRNDAKRMLNELLADIFLTQPTRLDIIKARLLELAVFLSRAAIEAGAEPQLMLGLNYEAVQKLSHLESFEDVCFWIVDVLDKFLDGTASAPESNSGLVRECIRFMHDNLDAKLTVADIAARVHLSPSRLSHLFKEETRMSVMDYLLKARLDDAKRLLASPGISVAQAAEQVGFADPAHFSRCFKRAEGIPPSAYRQRVMIAE